MFTDIWMCPVCSGEFSDNCLPRNLKCGHSVCSKCAEDFVDHHICVECLSKQVCKMVSDFPVNYPLLSAINSRKAREIFNEMEFIPSNLNDDLYPSHQYKDTWKCNVHGNTIMYLCYTCSTWTCKDCLVVDHVPLPRGSCRTIEFETGMRRVEKEYLKKADEIFKIIEDFRKTSELELGIHTFCLEHCPCDIRKHDRLVQETEKLLGVKKSSAFLVKDGKKKLEELKSSLHASTSPEELAALITETLSYADKLKQKIVKEKDVILLVTKLMDCHLRTVIKLLVEKKYIVYALQQNDQGTRWAPLTIQQEHLLLHSLRDGTPPDDGFIIPYEYASRLIPSDKTTIFFEIGTKEESSGFVYFRLISNMKFSKQLALMCSGEKGVSHRGTCFFKYDKETFSLYGGDYEKNDGTGGRNIMQDLEDTNWYFYSPYLKAGTLIADESSTRFSIRLRSIAKSDVSPDVMGRVREGLNRLQNLFKVKTVSQIIIRECGLFIPMNIRHMKDEEKEEKEEEV